MREQTIRLSEIMPNEAEAPDTNTTSPGQQASQPKSQDPEQSCSEAGGEVPAFSVPISFLPPFFPPCHCQNGSVPNPGLPFLTSIISHT